MPVSAYPCRIHCLRPPSHPPRVLHNLLQPLFTFSSQRPFSRCMRFKRSPSLHIGFYDRFQGDLRRHLLQQVVVQRRPGDGFTQTSAKWSARCAVIWNGCSV
ncbi:hypothetical protein M407DRAFT_233941 [Tulasnella calospora MUT 4182]|uniref:Uncharacterized protein n=1 Tax=Tulasnella calospora MUT 4182 TaxID=1051891 RepID=A0A0C3PNN8_9AGAM|nr:hypothetical protein M407DRAFT_233941 [Tulasnella calospora MUT 4182]